MLFKDSSSRSTATPTLVDDAAPPAARSRRTAWDWSLAAPVFLGLVLVGARPVEALPDLVAEQLDVSALQQECSTAQAAGIVVATVRNDGGDPVTSPARVLFFA